MHNIRFNQTIIAKNIENHYRETKKSTAALPADMHKGICNALMTLKAIEFFEAKMAFKGTTDTKEEVKHSSDLSPVSQLFIRRNRRKVHYRRRY